MVYALETLQLCKENDSQQNISERRKLKGGTYSDFSAAKRWNKAWVTDICRSYETPFEY